MDSIILWNPVIRPSLTLILPCFTFDNYGPYMFALGFGVDPKTNDHKAVRLAYVQEDDGYIVPSVVEALIKGVVHWVAYHLSKKERARTFHSLIMSFDLGSDEFGELKLPESSAGASPINMSAAVFRGSLTILQYDRQIWTRGGVGVVLVVRGNDELLLATSSGELVSYSYGAGTGLSFGKCGTKDSFYADSYSESLILLTERNKGLGREASMVSSASSSADDESGGENEGEDFAVESNELWVKSVILQYTNALLSQL
ncbi:hypothetical protein Acr_00g0031610 [Actinidia rufa]|uniref:Uncharacterized protein n=1 Tax=Actinidia rufa TaxID=165716 RepID=A0A7J0DF56_9ERIC|nr:hypothetical protein Acr_00g0031610 [Actinidia rufa]